MSGTEAETRGSDSVRPPSRGRRSPCLDAMRFARASVVTSTAHLQFCGCAGSIRKRIIRSTLVQASIRFERSPDTQCCCGLMSHVAHLSRSPETQSDPRGSETAAALGLYFWWGGSGASHSDFYSPRSLGNESSDFRASGPRAFGEQDSGSEGKSPPALGKDILIGGKLLAQQGDDAVVQGRWGQQAARPGTDVVPFDNKISFSRLYTSQ